MKTELLHKYLAGECNRREEKEVENWLDLSPRNREMMDEIQQIWSVSPGKRIDVDSHEAWASFREQFLHPKETDSENAHISTLTEKQKKLTKNYNRSRWMNPRSVIAYAGVAAAVLLITFLFYNQHQSTKIPGPELSMQEITTKKGQQTSLKLSDGSLVQLNAESKLIVPKNYMDTNRVVHLEGEAYFEIVPDPHRKFLVYANNSITQVLGTKFNVRAYPDEDKVEVVVAEGKVSVSSDDDTRTPKVQLTQNQRGTFSKNGEMEASTISDLGQYMDWTKGKLTFHDASVEEVKDRLERWYDVEVILNEDFSENNQLLTGSFENTPLSVVLSSIALSLDIRYTQDGSTVIFRKK